MPTDSDAKRIATRPPLNLAELVAQHLVDLSDLVLADAKTLLAAEVELLEQIERLGSSAVAPEPALERLLGYAVAPRAGDLHDYVERRLVTEYLIATGVDAAVLPLVTPRLPYSHIARDLSLVAMPGAVAPEAIIRRLTTCPRVLLYGLDETASELRGRLFRRLISVTAPGWPERTAHLAKGAAAAKAEDLRALLDATERGAPPPPVAEATPSPARPTAADRRRSRRVRLDGSE